MTDWPCEAKRQHVFARYIRLLSVDEAMHKKNKETINSRTLANSFRKNVLSTGMRILSFHGTAACIGVCLLLAITQRRTRLQLVRLSSLWR